MVDKEITRRQFLGKMIGAISGVVGAIIAVPLIGYILSPAWKKTSPLLTPIARTSDIPSLKPTYVTYEERVQDGWYLTTLSKGAWLVNKGSNNFVAFEPHCTHLNCPYYWDNDKKIFFCPCHDGRFDIDGNVIGGPPPRPLDRLKVVVQGEDILISDQPVSIG